MSCHVMLCHAVLCLCYVQGTLCLCYDDVMFMPTARKPAQRFRVFFFLALSYFGWGGAGGWGGGNNVLGLRFCATFV